MFPTETETICDRKRAQPVSRGKKHTHGSMTVPELWAFSVKLSIYINVIGSKCTYTDITRYLKSSFPKRIYQVHNLISMHFWKLGMESVVSFTYHTSLLATAVSDILHLRGL